MVVEHPTPEHPLEGPDVTAVERVRLGLLGLNAWVVVFLVPTLHLDLAVQPSDLLALLPLAVLGAGVVWLGSRPDLARTALLAFFPPALGLAVAVRPELIEREIFDPITILLGAASLLAYTAAAAHACGRPQGVKPTSAHPSRSRDPVVEPPARRWTRRVLLTLAALGGFAIVGVAPVWTERMRRAERWGEAIDDGAVLTIVVAALAASFAIGAVIGPALRAERRSKVSPTRRKRRLALAALVATAAGVGWLLLNHFDGAP